MKPSCCRSGAAGPGPVGSSGLVVRGCRSLTNLHSPGPRLNNHRASPPWTPPRRAGSAVELVDVLPVEAERLAEQDVVPLDLDGAEPAGLEPGVARLQGAGLEVVRGAHGQVAQVHR